MLQVWCVVACVCSHSISPTYAHVRIFIFNLTHTVFTYAVSNSFLTRDPLEYKVSYDARHHQQKHTFKTKALPYTRKNNGFQQLIRVQ